MAQQPAVEAAWQLVAKGDRDQAVALLRDLIRQRTPQCRCTAAAGQRTDGGWAARRIDRAASRRRAAGCPKSAEAHNALGEAYNTFGDAAAAQPEFERAVELDPKHAQAHENLGDVLLQQGEAQAAAPHLDALSGCWGISPMRRIRITCAPKSTPASATR